MSRRSRFVSAVSLCAVAMMGSTSVVEAGGPGGNRWNDVGDGIWYYGPSGYQDQAIAAFGVSYPGACLVTTLTGSDFHFVVSVNKAEKITDWNSLIDCFVTEGSNEVRTSEVIDPNDYFEVGFGVWVSLDSDIAPRLFPCLNVSASQVGNSEIGAIVVILKDFVDLGADYGIGRGKFFDVRQLLFLVGLESNVVGTETELSWTFDVDIRECGGYDGPDIDIEHYRRLAEEADLPSTR